MPIGFRLRISQRHLQAAAWFGISCVGLTGCLSTSPKGLSYIGKKPVTDYLDKSVEIAHPVLQTVPDETRAFPLGPRTIQERLDANQVWDMHLTEAIQLALRNNKIARLNDRSTLQGNNSRVMTSGDAVTTVYDPSIQETGVLFGGRGIESALSAFDAQLTSNFNMGRTEVVQNNVFNGGGLPAGSTLASNTGQMVTSLSKQAATGATMSLSHEVDYLQNNIPSALFPSSYSGNIAANLRQPLLAGAGVAYTRVAGPIGQNIQGLSGVNQGVLIARINNDITIADFEYGVNNMVFDTEKLYWDLHFAYRRYASAVANRIAGEKTWQDVKVKFDEGAEGGDGFLEAQARDAYFDRKAQEQAALASIDSQESSLRRMCGLPLNDGRIIRPADEPITAEFKPDWNADLAMALTRRVELRRQKWNIKSSELQMEAAKSLTKPRLDLVSSYQVNGFGDQLLSDHSKDGVTREGFHNFYDSVLRGNQTSWNSGVQFSMPFGFRAAIAQVRNLELRLAKSRAVLKAQEDDIVFELAQAYQDLTTNWTNAQTYFNRRLAAEEQASFIEQKRLGGDKNATLRDQLEAQAHMADAETAYYQAIIEYTKSVAHVNYRKGALLELNNVFLSEGSWNQAAYEDALERAWERSYSIEHPLRDLMITAPPPFSTNSDPGTTTYSTNPNAIFNQNQGQSLDPLNRESKDPALDGIPAPPLTEPTGAPGIDLPEADKLPDPSALDGKGNLEPEGPIATQPGNPKF
jgi:outer membrane protein TolC